MKNIAEVSQTLGMSADNSPEVPGVAVPFGLVACRLPDGGHPLITYLNEPMLRILGCEADGADSAVGSDLYLFVPMCERKELSQLISQAIACPSPVAGSVTVLRPDGKKVRLFGWLTAAGESGELHCLFADVTASWQSARIKEAERYVTVLRQVYDEIFECDFSEGTIQCLYDRTSSAFSRLRRVPMQLEQAVEQFVCSCVIEEDCERVRSFVLREFASRSQSKENGEVSEESSSITFRALAQGGGIKGYEAVMLGFDSRSAMLCFRCASESDGYSSFAVADDEIRRLVMNVSDGVVAFEVEDAKIRPLYSSENVYRFFGYSREEWGRLTEGSRSLRDFVSKSPIGYDEFLKVLENGEAEFEYVDASSRMTKRVRAVCPKPVNKDGAPRYVMLYNLQNKPDERRAVRQKVYIRTFGYFDVFIENKPIAFRNEKSKELFAILVNRRGGYVSSEEAISCLWENEPVNSVTLARYRKVALRLKNILEEYGISDVVEAVNGKRRIVIENVSCDLYDYLSGKSGSKQLFKGSYLTNYSWGEATLAELMS